MVSGAILPVKEQIGRSEFVQRRIRIFIRNNQLLLSFVSFVFITIPNTIENSLSLFDRFTGSSTTTESTSVMNISWLYWITIPLGLFMFGFILWIAKKPILTNTEKNKVSKLIGSVNTLENMMDRYFEESLKCADANKRTSKFQSLLDSDEYKCVLDKYLEQRADMITISPDLENGVRLLITLVQNMHHITLSKQYNDELPSLKKKMEEIDKSIETLKKYIHVTIKKLIQ